MTKPSRLYSQLWGPVDADSERELMMIVCVYIDMY